ncbi:MAG: hypothetical protein AB7F22_18375 [Reyranella sp.]|uniref:hypothetical protein n=1 Tax=Reyranella sp. TaxID=1929291 RepID=UPI003D124789
MRFLFVCLVLLLPGCEQSFFMVGDKGREASIARLSEARDDCLSRNASADIIPSTDPATIARAVALACSEETDRLVTAINRDGDTKVTLAIRQNSEFRAMGYVLRARGQVIF